jgi:hypothetical protein
MRIRAIAWPLAGALIGMSCSLIGSGEKSVSEPDAQPVVIKTVPPSTPGPKAEGGAKLNVRPVKNVDTEKALAQNKTVGPVITFAGISRADGKAIEPDGKTRSGDPIFMNYVGSGFMVVIEAKPGFSNLEVGRSIFHYDPEDPSTRPDLEIQVDKPLGDGSTIVCDARPPKIGGIPAIEPPSFAETAKVTGALNDLSCRFEVFGESEFSCSVDDHGSFAFRNEESTQQFCMVVARKWRFQEGDTTVSVRLRDREGNPGPVSKFILRKTIRATSTPRPPVVNTPTPIRRRP